MEEKLTNGNPDGQLHIIIVNDQKYSELVLSQIIELHQESEKLQTAQYN